MNLNSNPRFEQFDLTEGGPDYDLVESIDRRTTGTYVAARADRVVKFFSRLLRHSKGPFAGQPFDLQPWQIDEIINPLFGTIREDGTRQYRTAYVEIPRKNGKALALDTPIPTPTGWTQMGDLQVGDFVFDEQGQKSRVIAATSVMQDRPCYEVIFSDGERIVADEEHLWYTSARRNGLPHTGLGRKSSWNDIHIRTTKRIAETLTVQCPSNVRTNRIEWNHSVPVAPPIQCEPAVLPVSPYLLGAWLGDGHGATAMITTIDAEILTAIEEEGTPVRGFGGHNITYGLGNGSRKQSDRNRSVAARLRRLGVLNNKHIPAIYQRASITQRMELLRGLMDTDGWASKVGQCEFTSTSKALALGVKELVTGLGFKPLWTEDRARLNGRDIGPVYSIQFWSFQDRPVFALTRKRVRLKELPATVTRSQRRHIVACNPISSVPVRCIQVDSERGLFLAGRSMIPTHNSSIAAGIALYMLVADGEEGAEIYGAAADKDQAGIVFAAASEMVHASPELSQILKVIDSTKRIVYRKKNSFYRAIPNDAAGSHGFNASCIIFDEVHTQPNRELWQVLTTSTGARSQPLTFAITTAGYDRNSLCWDLHVHADQIQRGIVDNPSWFPYILSAPEKDANGKDVDWMDERVWYSVNPGLGVFRSIDEMRDLARTAQHILSEQNTFRQLYLNQWCVSPETIFWLSNGERAEARGIETGAEVIAFDERNQTLTRAKVLAVTPMAPAPSYRIVTARGREITVNAGHPFWVRKGQAANPRYEWERADQLVPGSRIGVALGHPPLRRGSFRIDGDSCRFLGVMIGDGSMVDTPQLTTIDPELVEFFGSFVTRLGDEPAVKTDGVHHYARHGIVKSRKQIKTKSWLKARGVWGSRCHDKRVPSCVWKAGPRGWAAFLSGYLDTDGHVSTESVVFVSANRDLLRDSQDLLAYLGIQSAIRESPSKLSTLSRWRLEILDAASFRICQKVLTPLIARKKAALANLPTLGRRESNAGASCKDIPRFDRVLSVTIESSAATIGMTIEGVHTHITDGLITHNTAQATRWLNMSSWDRGGRPIDVDRLKGKLCFAGLDVSGSIDLSAIVLLFPTEDGGIEILAHFWIPSENIVEKEKRDRVPYQQWIKDGFITATPGAAIDHAYIRNQINDYAALYDMRELGADPYNAHQLIMELAGDGIDILPVRQGFLTLSPPTKELQRLVVNNKIQHGGNPVLRWMADNVMISRDAAGNIKPDKQKSTQKIDGMSALINAIDRYSHANNVESVYESHGVRTIG